MRNGRLALHDNSCLAISSSQVIFPLTLFTRLLGEPWVSRFSPYIFFQLEYCCSALSWMTEALSQSNLIKASRPSPLLKGKAISSIQFSLFILRQITTDVISRHFNSSQFKPYFPDCKSHQSKNAS